MNSSLPEILLILDSYPKPSDKRLIHSGISFAKRLGSSISALSFEIEFKVKTSSIMHAFGLDSGVLSLLKKEKRASQKNAKALIAEFEAAAKKASVKHAAILESAQHISICDLAVEHARYRDLTIVPTAEDSEVGNVDAESLLFESGRPILIPPMTLGKGGAISLRNIAVAWDSSRSAARALADSLPLLHAAENVRVFTVKNEKDLPETTPNARVRKYLANHEIAASFDSIDAKGAEIGTVIREYVKRNNIDLLVMGGYGHSRVKEFILGGATKSILDEPFQWTLLSH